MAQTLTIRTTWEEQPDRFPEFLQENADIFPMIKAGQKKENESLVQEFTQKVQRKLRQKPKSKEARNALTQELEQDFMDFLDREQILYLSSWMSPQLLDAFKRETKHFLDDVRASGRLCATILSMP